MISKITETEKQIIKKYIDACVNTSNHPNPQASVETILSPWAAAKSEYLSSIFKDELIIQTPVEFMEEECEIQDKIKDNLLELPEFKQIKKKIKNAVTKWEDRHLLCHIFSEKTLADNKISFKDIPFHSPYEFPLPNGKTLKIQDGAKPFRIIKKIFQAFDIEEELIENFRNIHSQCLNTKKLSGNLCLSIHPLDYMTMSDNNSGWDSCMSWMNDGEYRQGTVEMMNSPCVVVAYLEAKEDMYMPGDYRWNNKKWRCLFIVNNECAISVRQYPYYNDNLVKEVLYKISELSGWGKTEPFFYDYREYRRSPLIQNNRKVQFTTYTNNMYNDFGSDKHQMIINPNITDNFIREITYSGASECMWCGVTNDCGFDTADTLSCDQCSERNYCPRCGCTLYEGDEYFLNDYAYCCDCFNEISEWDDLLQDYEYYENVKTIHLSKSNKKFKESGYEFHSNPWRYEFSQHFSGGVKRKEVDETTVYYVTPNQIINPHHLLSYHLDMNEEAEKKYTRLAL